MDARHAVGAVAHRVDGANALAEARVRDRALRGKARPPCVVAALGHLQDTAERRDAVDGLVRLHESVRRLGVATDSCANQAAAFLGCHAPHAAPAPRAAAARVRRARPRRPCSPSELACSRRCCWERYCHDPPTASSSCGCSARCSRTLVRGFFRSGRLSTARPPAHGTPAGMGDVTSASWDPFRTAGGTPRNRGNFNAALSGSPPLGQEFPQLPELNLSKVTSPQSIAPSSEVVSDVPLVVLGQSLLCEMPHEPSQRFLINDDGSVLRCRLPPRAVFVRGALP
ncbi:hypothetical protein MYXA107069_35865 [Myxococcus xanthus]